MPTRAAVTFHATSMVVPCSFSSMLEAVLKSDEDGACVSVESSQTRGPSSLNAFTASFESVSRLADPKRRRHGRQKPRQQINHTVASLLVHDNEATSSQCSMRASCRSLTLFGTYSTGV